MRRFVRENRGFTLIELIIVIAIIAILSTVLVPQYLSYLERARQSNDLQVSSAIIKAATLAVIDPDSDIAPGHYVELIWITGEESGSNVTRGSIIIRHNDTERISIYNDGEGDDDVPATSGSIENLRPFANSVFRVLGGGEATHLDGYSSWLQIEFMDAESSLANESNFAIHINTSTGEVALADYPGSSNRADPNRWVEMGLDVIPAPIT